MSTGPYLISAERDFPCGYAPRAILLAPRREAIFVGSKEGTLTVIEPKNQVGKNQVGEDERRHDLADFKAESVAIASEDGGILPPRPIRALCEWDKDHLLVGRGDGSVLKVHLPSGKTSWRIDLGDDEPKDGESKKEENTVRSIVRLDPHAPRFAVSVRGRGVYEISEADRAAHVPGFVERGLEDVRHLVPLQDPQKVLGGAADQGTRSTTWLLVTGRADLWLWDGTEKVGQGSLTLVPEVWHEDDRPGLVSDFALLRSEEDRREGRGGRAVLLATDSGVYHLELRSDQPGRLFRERLALPGLAGMATAITYSEDARFRYLWAADPRGDSHLFWAPGNRTGVPPPNTESFRRSGVLKVGADVVVCFLWARAPRREEPPLPDLLVAQARRNDRLVLGRYWNPKLNPEGEDETRRWTRYRRLLNDGTWEGEEVSRSPLLLAKAVDGLPEGEETHAWQESDLDDWPGPTLLAELFERLGEGPLGRNLLLDGLRSPQSEIVKLLLTELDGGARSSEATRLWTQSLLGVIHRSPGDQQVGYVGLLRWLRRRQEEAVRAGRDDLVTGLQNDLGFARKWGLAGEVNADREDLVRPIEILRSQNDPDHQDRGLALDLLTYEALLFHRSVNLLERHDEHRLRGRTAWDVSVMHHQGNGLLAVSWMWGGVDLVRMRPAPRDPTDTRFELLCHLLPGEKKSRTPGDREIRQDKRGYSRAVHLGEVDGRAFIITSPTLEGLREEIHVWTLGETPPPLPGNDTGSQPESGWSAELADSFELPPGESLFSLHEVEAGWLVAGLRGAGGVARIASLQLRTDGDSSLGWVREAPSFHSLGRPPADGERAPVRSEGEEEIRFGEGSGEAAYRRNRAWSLASSEISEPQRAGYQVFVGTEEGRIFRVKLLGTRNGEASFDRSSEEVVVHNLSSPVLCLAFRRSEGDLGSQPRARDGQGRRAKPLSRLYAGCEDGSIVAWEELFDEEGSKEEDSHAMEASRFAVLWATLEEGPVADLHLFDFTSPLPNDILGPAILVVTRQGRAVILDDRDEVRSVPDPSQDGAGRSPSDARTDRPRRFPFPGSRFGRLSLPDSAFASVLLNDGFGLSKVSRDELGAHATLLSASGEGTLSLTSLHTPAKTRLRKGRFEDVLALWRRVVASNVDWRLGEAVFRAAPILSLIIVRWLLDPTFPLSQRSSPPGATDSEEPGDPRDDDFDSYWLPRHLRPLLEVHRLWPRWDEAAPAEAAWNDRSTNGGPAGRRTVGSALEAALRRAWRLDDLDVFQEITALALKRTNFDLYHLIARQATEQCKPLADEAWKLYEEVYEAIERSLQLWLGAPDRREARARAVFAKHMVDGDTALQLFRAAADESLNEDQYFQKILSRRVAGVRQLVHMRDPLVSLEALRAANLSLMRLCKRLVDSRGDWENWHPSGNNEPSKEEIFWPVFEGYFDRLTAVAERTLGARREPSDALAHEHTRTFALAICACPSAAIRIANRLTETRLIRNLDDPGDLASRILRQLSVLNQIGIGAPAFASRLFALVTRLPGPEDELNPVNRNALRACGLDLELARSDELMPARIGVQNTEDLRFLRILHEEVARPFVKLAQRLATNAEYIDLSDQVFEGLYGALGKLGSDDKAPQQDPYRESRRFWRQAVTRLGKLLQPVGGGPLENADTEEPKPGLGVGRVKVRPEAVVAGRVLGVWARDMIDDLDQRKRDGRIFVPEHLIFRQILSNLARAAEEFPQSAAVQKNIVRGILGHHLLEDLDEHVLELGEIAQALDPSMSLESYEEPEDAADQPVRFSTARHFARYLVRRSQSAEGIPKNLRVLQTLLASRISDKDAEHGIEDLVRPYQSLPPHLRWHLEDEEGTRAGKLSRRELSFLRLTLEELAQNQKRHSDLKPSPRREAGRAEHSNKREGPGPSGPVVSRTADGRGLKLAFPFRFRPGDEQETSHSNYRRLCQIRKRRLQEPFLPRPDGRAASTGAGLYLANLAAAVVGWKLELNDVRPPSGKDGDFATCHFTLTAAELDPALGTSAFR